MFLEIKFFHLLFEIIKNIIVNQNASDHFLLHKYSYTHKWTFIENYQLTQNGEIILKIVYKIVWNTH